MVVRPWCAPCLCFLRAGAASAKAATGGVHLRARPAPLRVSCANLWHPHTHIMPPQTRAAARRVVSPTPLDALPLALALRIFSLLPADARLLAAAVCRSWRAMLAERSLWTRLDLSEASGVDNPTPLLLRAAAARAGGQLESLTISHYGD
jgi:hypothetical protein